MADPALARQILRAALVIVALSATTVDGSSRARVAKRDCSKLSVEQLQARAKRWIVSRMTKRQMPHAATAIPEGTRVSAIEARGFANEQQRLGLVFYTQVAGGIAYIVFFEDDCRAEYQAELCPNEDCMILNEAFGAPPASP